MSDAANKCSQYHDQENGSVTGLLVVCFAFVHLHLERPGCCDSCLLLRVWHTAALVTIVTVHSLPMIAAAAFCKAEMGTNCCV